MNAQALMESAGRDRDARRARLLGAGLAFLLYEAVLIALLNGDLFGQIGSDLLYLAIVVIGAGTGYLLLGTITGSWESAFLLVVPVFIAMAIGGTAETDSLITDGIPIYIAWALFSIFFVPAWLVGLLLSLLLRDPEETP